MCYPAQPTLLQCNPCYTRVTGLFGMLGSERFKVEISIPNGILGCERVNVEFLSQGEGWVVRGLMWNSYPKGKVG